MLLLFQVKVIEDYPVYTIENFIGEVGGYLGLLLGASLPSIYDQILSSCKMCYFSVKK